MDNTQSKTNFADKKKLVKALLIFSIIMISWLTFPSNRLWTFLDTTCAKSFNYLFVHSSVWRSIALFCNSRKADWIFDLVIVAFLVPAYKKKKHLPLSTLLLAISICASVHFASFRIFSRRAVPYIFQFERKSPSLSIENYIRVNEIVPNCKTKDSSNRSFPGDHGTTCALFFIVSTILFGKRAGVIAFILSLPILLARCFVGAHWISDIVVGSCAMALLYLSLIFYTPFFDNIAKIVTLKRRKDSHVRIRKDL